MVKKAIKRRVKGRKNIQKLILGIVNEYPNVYVTYAFNNKQYVPEETHIYLLEILDEIKKIVEIE